MWRDRWRSQFALVRADDGDMSLDGGQCDCGRATCRSRARPDESADQLVLYDDFRSHAAVDAYFFDCLACLRNAFPGDVVPSACAKDRDCIICTNGNVYCV